MLNKFFKNKQIENALVAVEKNPDNLLKLNILGDVYVQNNFFSEAINVYEKILRLDENYLPALKALGNCYLQKKEVLKAFRTLKFLCLKAPSDIEARELFLSLQDADCDIEAKVEILKGLVEFDASLELKEKLAETFLKSGQFAQSIKSYENLFGIEQKPEYLIKLSELYQKLNKYELATNSLEQLMLTNDFSMDNAQTLAELYVKLKRFEEAKGLYEVLIENIPAKANYFKEKIADILLKEQNPDEVLEVTQEVINDDKYSVEAKFLQAKALLDKNDFVNAIEFLRDFYCDPIDKQTEKKIEEKIITASILYAQQLRQERKFVEAIDALILALRYDENNKNVYLELANISNDIKDFSSAKEYQKIADTL